MKELVFESTLRSPADRHRQRLRPGGAGILPLGNDSTFRDRTNIYMIMFRLV